jgi:UTP-glucose-1-phosphate uridylyltransferase
MTIGLIPAAGHSTRIHGLPKFLLPMGDSYLLDIMARRMLTAGAEHVNTVTSFDNYGLLERFKTDECTAYMRNTNTMSETVLEMRKYSGDNDVLFGMPDSYWTDDQVYEKLLDCLNKTTAIVSLALFDVQAGQWDHVGMCYTAQEDNTTHIIKIVDKPKIPELGYGCLWGAMAWRSEFWKYIHAVDPHVGFAAQRAIEAGETVTGVTMDSYYYDCGTPERYFECIREVTACPLS